MNLLKKNLSMLFIIPLLFLITACGQAEPTPEPAEEPTTAPALQPVEETGSQEETVDEPTAEPTPIPEEEPAAPEQSDETAESYPPPAEIVTAEDDSYPAPAVVQQPAADTTDSYPAPAADDTTTATTRTYTVVTDQSNASYIVAETFFAGAQERLGIEAGLVDTIGTTQDVSGDMTINFGETIELVSGTFEVNIQALTSDQSRRDERIQEQYLESAAFPIATFEATAIENFPNPYREGAEVTFDLIGNLTVRETTLPVTFETNAVLSGDTITAGAVTTLLMSDFGVTPPDFSGLFTVEDEFQVTLLITMIEQQ